jgi:hypothetical protein
MKKSIQYAYSKVTLMLLFFYILYKKNADHEQAALQQNETVDLVEFLLIVL